jgi:hypothetical protein
MTEEEREFLEWMNQTEYIRGFKPTTPTKIAERNEDKAINWDLERIYYDLNRGLK